VPSRSSVRNTCVRCAKELGLQMMIVVAHSMH
jgi:hypothetical protein